MTIGSISSQLRMRHSEFISETSRRTNKIQNEKPQKQQQNLNIVQNDNLIRNEQLFQGNRGKIQEIKQFAQHFNMTDVEDDDIHYAMTNGTSLFADYSA